MGRDDLAAVCPPIPPEPLPRSATGAGALLVNFNCALLLVRFKHHGGSLGLAAFLSARNEVSANAAIILAGLLTSATQSIWPDLIVGLGIALFDHGRAFRKPTVSLLLPSKKRRSLLQV